MSFARAQEKRFNEVDNHIPSPTRYFPPKARIIMNKGVGATGTPAQKEARENVKKLHQEMLVERKNYEIQRLRLEHQNSQEELQTMKMELERKNARIQELEQEIKEAKKSANGASNSESLEATVLAVYYDD